VTAQEKVVPKSRIRRRSDYSPPAAKTAKLPGAAGRWIAPTALALLGLGLAWIVVFYLGGNDIPVMKSLDNWNLLIGMGLITSGFVVLTRWK